MLSHFNQKLLVFSLWFCINVALIVTAIVFSNYWYIFIVPLSLSTSFNCLSVIVIVLVRIKNLFIKQKKAEKSEYSKRNLAFLVPCYNETEDELKNTIDSIKNQDDLENNNKMLFIVCDGRVKSQNAETSTDNILKNMFKQETVNSMVFKDAYNTWSGEKNNVEVFMEK